MASFMTWLSPTLDVLAVVLLTGVLWRLGRDPGAGWSEREARLQAIFDDLRTLVAQSEGLARELDGKLAAREARLRALVAEGRAVADAAQALAPVELKDEWSGDERKPDVKAPAAPAPTAPAARAVEADPATIAARIEALADAGRDVDVIAKRLGVPVAEVRLVIGLKAARAARLRTTAALQERAHA
jgi:hypothetical protein